MEITFYLTNQSKSSKILMVNISIYLIIILIVYRTFFNIKLIFEFSKTIGEEDVLVFYLRKEIG